jgi:hypothetical protein
VGGEQREKGQSTAGESDRGAEPFGREHELRVFRDGLDDDVGDARETSAGEVPQIVESMGQEAIDERPDSGPEPEASEREKGRVRDRHQIRVVVRGEVLLEAEDGEVAMTTAVQPEVAKGVQATLVGREQFRRGGGVGRIREP